MGFRWDDIRVRITPQNGAVEEVMLGAAAFPEGQGPLRTRPTYVRESDEEPDVLRTMRQTIYGHRVRVEMEFWISTMTSQLYLSRIVAALQHPGKTVELSLDAGATYREVVLDSDFTPEPIGGQWQAGAVYRLALICAELLAEPPEIATVDSAGNSNVW